MNNLLNADAHPVFFERPVTEEDILKDIDTDLFSRTPKSIESERELLVKGSTPKQGKIFEENCNKQRNNCSYEGIHEKNIINQLFFSSKNIVSVQNMIRLSVHKFSKFIIGKQSNEELLIVMRSIYLQYSQNPVISDPIKQKKIIHKEIFRLNQIVVNEVVPNVVSETQQYIHYLKDISQVAQPHQRGKNDSVKGTKNMRDISEIFSI
jgi:hypothetical protein